MSPSFDRVNGFAVFVHYTPLDRSGREVQFARIDTTHGSPHFDRLHRRDQPNERLDVDVPETAGILKANRRTYAERFDDLDRE